MSNEPVESAPNATQSSSASVQHHEWQTLTPLELLRRARQWSVKSWLFVLGVVIVLVSGSWSAGYAYRAGQLSELVYAFEQPDQSPLAHRRKSEQERQFVENYDELLDWQKLRPVIAGIAEEQPDGLQSEFEIAASLLAQIRGTRGEARFLAGTMEHSVRMKPGAGGMQLEWESDQSIVPRIARDVGYELTEDDLRVANSNLNWAQFTYLDDDMQHAVIYRGLDGALNLTIWK